MNERNYDANPVPKEARRLLGASAAVLVVAAYAAACWTAGPGNWVPLAVRSTPDRMVTTLPPVLVTARADPQAGALRPADGTGRIACADGAGAAVGR